jgi:hypothetical protein
MNSKLSLKSKEGLTLLEIVISISIFVLVSATISFIFNRALFVYRASINKNKAAQEAQVAMEWLARDISLATCIYQANANSISLNNPDWGCVKYYLSGSTTLLRNDCTSDYLLSENIAGFNLNYYDSANQSTAFTSEIKSVEINLATTSGDQRFDLYSVTSPESTTSGCLWAKTYGGNFAEEMYSLQQTSDGGYILGGRTRSFGAGYDDFFTIKTDSQGTVQWANAYGGSGYDYLYSLQQTQDGGYILGGYVFDPMGQDFLLIKTNSFGSKEWARRYAGISFSWHGENFYSLQQTSDGFILGYYTTSFGVGGSDFLVIKTDSSGSKEWARTYGGSSDDYLYSLQQTTNGGYILGGHTGSFGIGITNPDFFLIKTDSSGELMSCSIIGDVTTTVTVTTPDPTVTTPDPTVTTPDPVINTTPSLITADVTSLLTITPICPE